MLRKPAQIMGMALLLLSLTSPLVSSAQCTPPSVTLQPSNATVCGGGNTTLTVGGAGTDINYQWEVNTGSGYTPVSNGSQYSGATTSTLSVSGVTSSMSSYQYRCVITGACTPSATSDAAGFVLHTAATITTQPQASTICAGANTSFGIAATGTDVTYQWQVNSGSGFINVANGGVYVGATAATLNISGATDGMNSYEYRCLVTNACGTLTSDAAALTVNALPNVSASPASGVACLGANKTLSVTASGAGISYQWQLDDGSGFGNISDGSVYAGTQAASLTIYNAAVTMNGHKFRCVVSGTCNPSAISGEATLSVHEAPAITGQPSNSVLCDGQNTSFTVTSTGTSLTYQWQVDDGTGFVNVTNAGAYTNATTNSLSITGATPALTGRIYRCLIGNGCGNETSNTATLTVNELPVIITQPSNVTTCMANTATFTVANSGSTMTYQWQENTGSGFTNITDGGVYSGATTASLVITGTLPSFTGRQYRCILNNGNCSLTSSNATLTVQTLPVITTQPASSTICEGGNTSFTTAATGTGISYQWQENKGSGFTNITNTGIYSGATSATLSLTAAGLAVNGYQYRCVVSGTCSPEATTADVTLTVNEKPSVSVQPANTTVCIGTNAMFTVTAAGTALTYQWQVDNGSGYLNVGNTGIYSGANSSTLTLTAPPASATGYKYRCIVTGTCSPSVTTADAQLIVHDVKIVNESGNNKVCEDKSAMFATTAMGTVVSYQWQVSNGSGYTDIVNNAAYSGANSPILSVNSVQPAMSGYTYRCVVTGVCTQATTSAMKLTVNDKPQVMQNPVSVTEKEGKEAVFSITAQGYDFYYYWQASTDNGKTFVNVQNNGTYSGASTNELHVKNVAITQDGYSFRCIVRERGACNFTADSSSWAYLTVQSRLAVEDRTNNTTSIQVYPNPVSGSVLNVKMPVSGNVEVRIVNTVGQTVSKEVVRATEGQNVKVDVANMPAGMYLLYAKEGENSIGQPVRFTKQ